MKSEGRISHVIVTKEGELQHHIDIEAFIIGDVVYLKSDLQLANPMTVISVQASYEVEQITCAWLNSDGDLQVGTLPKFALIKELTEDE